MLTDLSSSLRGWAEILAGKADAGRNFRLDYPGLVIAIGWFVAAVLLSVAAQSMVIGIPSLNSFFLGLVAQAVTVGALGFVMAQTLKFLKLDVPLNRLLVPTLYALAYMFLFAIPLTLISPSAGLIAVLAVGFLIFRAAGQLAGMPTGLAVAFALLCVIVLVVVPNALYILFLQIPSA